MLYSLFKILYFANAVILTAGFIQSPKLNIHSYSRLQSQGLLGEEFGGFNIQLIETENVENSVTKLHTLGEYSQNEFGSDNDREELLRVREFNMNVGKGMEVLRRELPLVFFASHLDFSIFAQQILVNDGNNNRMAMQKTLYSTVVKSLKLASTFSSMYPSMNVKKIEYIEDCSTIQCLVDVVLPDSIRIDGQAVWEGLFYFGLDSSGLISSHTFDRKISNKTPNQVNTKAFPWLRATPSWSPDLLVGAARIDVDTN